MTDFALTPCQLHLWKSQQISPECPLFNQVSTARLNAELFSNDDVALLHQAWQNLQRIHPVFTVRIRTSDDGLPTQTFDASPIPLVEASLDPDAADPAQHRQQWIDKRSQHTFVLDESLVDAVLLRQGASECMIYLNMHHLIADALSTTLVWQSLSDEYLRLKGLVGSSADTQHHDLPAAAATGFQDYLQSLCAMDDAAAPVAEQSIRRTTALPQLPEFYGERPGRPATRSTRHSLALRDDELQQFRALTEQAQFRLFNRNLGEMCLHLTVLLIYLRKVTDSRQIVVEAPIAGRFESRWKTVAGNFIEMIRLRVSVDDDDTIPTVYQRARDALFDALRDAAPGCTAQLQPELVHGVLNVITSDTESSRSVFADLRWHHAGHSDMNHPLRLHVSDWDNSGTPALEVDLNHACFDDSARERAPLHLAALYRALVEQQAITVGALSVLTERDRWSFTGAIRRDALPGFMTLPERVEQLALSHPEAVAVADEHESMSYGQLCELASNVSAHLRERGLGCGDRVVVCMSRGLNLPAVLLGVMKSGAAWIPIDSTQPAQRVLGILEEASVSCLVRDSGQQLAEVEHPLCVLASDLLLPVAGTAGASPSADSTPGYSMAYTGGTEDPAYIIFTSGSTGKPKGVIVSHRAMMSYLGWAERYYRLSEPIVMPLFTSIAFDLTVTSLFLPWFSGGHVQVFTQSDEDSTTLLYAVIASTAINTVKLTPAHLALLAYSNDYSSSIRQFIVGGEDLKCATAEQARACFRQDVGIVNEYGPTEVTVGCVVKDWQNRTTDGSVPIGLPIDGTFACVLDERGQPCVEGMVGELYLGGQSMASGYWNDETMTAERFVEHPWQAGEWLYRSGDLVRVKDGELHYLGRTDAQINLNGHRIELAEVEAALSSHPQINECVVLADQADVARQRAVSGQAVQAQAETYCSQCGLSSRYPESDMDDSGLCGLCRQFAQNKERVEQYFKSPDALDELVCRIQADRRGEYDAVVLLSGGKDSTFALCKLVDLGLKVYAFSLDNGYISDQAKGNIERVCRSLGVDHHYGSTGHMNEIFVDSLARYSNVCHGCFKTIYNLSMAFAAEHDIDYIFTGLSRGQLFETRLNNELFADTRVPLHKVDDMVQAARIQYHAIEDAPNRLLGIEAVNNGSLPAAITVVDFYRYCHVEMADMLAYLQQRADWIRPSDTGRSTNCLINDVGIHVHKLERGFHNYSLPYSWDVRLGHKTRHDVLDELNDEIDADRVNVILEDIGYTPDDSPGTRTSLSAFFTAAEPMEPTVLQQWLNARLPDYMHPGKLVQIAAMPLSASGKIDRRSVTRLPSIAIEGSAKSRSALTGQQQLIAEQWQFQLGGVTIGAEDNFFRLGGDSLSAIRCVMALRGKGYQIDPADLFRHPVLADFCSVLEGRFTAPVDNTVRQEKIPERFSSLKGAQSEQLKKLLRRGQDI